MTLELRPAGSLDHGALAALFTAAYEGYVLPMQITEEQLRFIVDASPAIRPIRSCRRCG